MDAYIRTVRGETKYLPVKRATEQFVGTEGYRITLTVGGVEFVIRRAEHPLPKVDAIGQIVAENCTVTIRGV